MEQNQSGFFKSLVIPILIGILFLVTVFFFPWKNIKWGKFQLTSPETVTVSGTATTQQKSQIANFSVGVTSVKDNKDEAVREVNTKITEVVAVIRSFGVDSKDIKTESMSVYQEQENYWDGDRQKTRPGQWRVSNNVSVILRDITKAGSLSTELVKTGATNIYGPNYVTDNQKEVETGLIEEAIKNATTKATTMALASGRKLGKIVKVDEGGTSVDARPVYSEMGGGGGGGEPGSSTVTKVVTVTFELE